MAVKVVQQKNILRQKDNLDVQNAASTSNAVKLTNRKVKFCTIFAPMSFLIIRLLNNCSKPAQ